LLLLTVIPASEEQWICLLRTIPSQADERGESSRFHSLSNYLFGSRPPGVGGRIKKFFVENRCLLRRLYSHSLEHIPKQRGQSRETNQHHEHELNSGRYQRGL